MGLKCFRTGRKMTQSALAKASGVNFRSLQDYEQGHKPIGSAGGEVLLRLASSLGCSVEELLLADEIRNVGAPVLPENTMTTEEISGLSFCCEQYGVMGRWVCGGGRIAVLFYYEGRQYLLPFSAVFRSELIPWLKAAAELQMEEAIEDTVFLQFAAR